MKKIISITAAILLSLGIVHEGSSRTKLTTLPERSKIRIDLKNSNFTLIEEERTINLQRGVNKIEFSWENTYIDMSSIQFRCVKPSMSVNILNVNYPPGGSALFWEVYSKIAGPGIFRISYLISNLNKSISYEAQCDKDEKYMVLKTYFTLKNLSGERFKNADIQINFGKNFKKSFLSGESKKMLAAKYRKVKIEKKYIFDAYKDSRNVRMYFHLKNSKTHGMGKFTMPPGKVRIFQEDSRGTEAFIGEDMGKYTPLGQTMKLYLGQAKEVKVKRFLYKNKKVYINNPVKNYKRIVKFRVQNFKKKNVPLTLVEHPGGEWIIHKIVLKKETGERNKIKEKTISYRKYITYKKEDVNNLFINFNVPPQKNNNKYNVYIYMTLKNRW